MPMARDSIFKRRMSLEVGRTSSCGCLYYISRSLLPSMSFNLSNLYKAGTTGHLAIIQSLQAFSMSQGVMLVGARPLSKSSSSYAGPAWGCVHFLSPKNRDR